MDEWKIRLKQAREAKGLNKTTFAKVIGVSNPTITDWEKDSDLGGIKEIAGPNLTKICEALDVTPGWLLYGKEAAVTPLAGVRLVYEADKDDPAFVHIPLVRLRLQAGMTGFQAEPDRRDDGELGMRKSWLRRNNFDPQHLVAIQVKGDSMEPALYEDDVVVINTADKKPVDGIAFAVNYEGEAVVKRLSRDAGDWWLTSDNVDQRKYHRKICRGDACIIIGRVVHKESDRI